MLQTLHTWYVKAVHSFGFRPCNPRPRPLNAYVNMNMSTSELNNGPRSMMLTLMGLLLHQHRSRILRSTPAGTCSDLLVCGWELASCPSTLHASSPLRCKDNQVSKSHGGIGGRGDLNLVNSLLLLADMDSRQLTTYASVRLLHFCFNRCTLQVIPVPTLGADQVAAEIVEGVR